MKPVDLAAGGAGRAQQPDLAGPLGDGHRQGVEDQERAAEQRERGDQRGGRLEVGRRGAERRPPGRPATERTYGSAVSRASSAAATLAASRRGRGRVDPRHAGRPEDGLRRRRVATTTVRPSAPASGPSPARIPTTARYAGRPAPCNAIGEPIARPVSRGQPLADQGARPSGPVQGVARRRARGRGARRYDRRVDAEDGHRRRQARRRWAGRVRRRDRCGARGSAPRPRRRACPRWRRPMPSTGRVSAKAATRRSARPTMSRTVRSIDAVDRRVGGQGGEQDRHAEARRRRSSGATGAVAPARLRQASAVSPDIGLEPELGEPGDERGGAVVGPPAELDLVADAGRRG